MSEIEYVQVAGQEAAVIGFKARKRRILVLDDASTYEHFVNEAKDEDSFFDPQIPRDTMVNLFYTACKYAKSSAEFYYMSLPDSRKSVFQAILKEVDPDVVVFASEATAKTAGIRDPLFKFSSLRYEAALKCDVVVVIPFRYWIDPIYAKHPAGPNLMGFTLRGLIAAVGGKNLAPDRKSRPSAEFHFVDTIDAFYDMMDTLESNDVISCDTEGTSLGRITCDLICVQFGVRMKGKIHAFFVPLFHSETPWSRQQLDTIIDELYHFFMNTKATLVFQNSSYDIGQFLALFKVEHFNATIYDTMAGEFLLDENAKFLKNVAGHGSAYSLETLEARHGFIRGSQQIDKDKRGNMAAFTLDEIFEYGCWDVVSLLEIREHQRDLSIHPVYGYESRENFELAATHQIGIMQKVFATMQYNGIKIDLAHLVKLSRPDGPFADALKELYAKLMSYESAQKANRLVLNSTGHTGDGLFGKNKNVLSLSKPSHLDTLFFKVLKLQPLSTGKNGLGSINAAFKKAYSGRVPEVELLRQYGEINKMKTAFADSLLSLVMSDEDFKIDGRVRPSFNFTPVLTGRCLAEDTPVYVCDERRSVAIKDIAVGDYVWSYNIKKKVPEPKRVVEVFDNGVKSVLRLHYRTKSPNGQQYKYIDVTPNHKILLADGTYRMAKDLRPNDRVMAMERYTTDWGYSKVVGNCIQATGKPAIAEHRLAMLDDLDNKLHVHHVDGIKLNNSPDNLEVIDGAEHGSLHFKMNPLIMKGKDHHLNVAKYLGVGIKESKRLLKHTNNHWIDSIEYLQEKVQTYDIEVEDNHNFFANGCGVSNSSTYRPNTTQIPTRSEIAKEIKKIFTIELDLGNVMLASDFSAHEVRMSGVISRDEVVCNTFKVGLVALRKFRLTKKFDNIEKALDELELELDTHIQNALVFYGKRITKEDQLRKHIKNVVFSAIYGAMAKKIAKTSESGELQTAIDNIFKAKRELTELQNTRSNNYELIDALKEKIRVNEEIMQRPFEYYLEQAEDAFNRLEEKWHVLFNWMEDTKKIASETFHAKYPNNRIRHLWGYLSSDIWVHRAMDRRAVNSIIQGFSADIGIVASYLGTKWAHTNCLTKNLPFLFKQLNLVHDATYRETSLRNLPLAVYVMEHSMSTMPFVYYRDVFKYEFPVELGYDVDFGTSWDTLKEWKRFQPNLLYTMIGDLGEKLKIDAKPVIEDAKKIIQIREEELRLNRKDHMILKGRAFQDFARELNMFN